SWYARKYGKPDALIGLYVAFVIAANIMAIKIAAFDLGFSTFIAPAATLIFAVTFLITDIVNERFGKNETLNMIRIALVAQIVMVFFIWLTIAIPPAPFWSDQQIFETILGFAPRIMVASWIAFYISESLDAHIFAWFKEFTKGKQLWMRNVFSSIPSMAVDSMIFVTLAFYGLQPIVPIFIGLIAMKWLVGLVDIPFMYANRWVLHKS
ncbi:MAG: queuosine precursor transporter, partial [archaeon]|nr:queuosine precursor transporter [archaeon]